MTGLSRTGNQSPSSPLPLPPCAKVQVMSGEFGTAMVSASPSREKILTHLYRDWTLAKVNNQLPRIDFSMLVTSPVDAPSFSSDSPISHPEEEASTSHEIEPVTMDVFVMANGLFSEKRGKMVDTHFAVTHVETLGMNSDARQKEAIVEETQINNALALGMTVGSIDENSLVLEKDVPQVHLKFTRGIKTLPNPTLSLFTRDQLNEMLYQNLFPQTKLQRAERATAEINLVDICSEHYKNPVPIDAKILNGKWELKLLNGCTSPVFVTFEFTVTENKYKVVRNYEGDITQSFGYVEGATLKAEQTTPATTIKGTKTLAAEVAAIKATEIAVKSAANAAITATAKAATAAAAVKMAKVAAVDATKVAAVDATKVAAVDAAMTNVSNSAEALKAITIKTVRMATTEAVEAAKEAEIAATKAAKVAATPVRKTGWSRLGNFLIWDGVISHPDFSVEELKKEFDMSPPKIVSFSDKHLLFANDFSDSYLLVREGASDGIVEYESSEESLGEYSSIYSEQSDWLPSHEENLELGEIKQECIKSETELCGDVKQEKIELEIKPEEIKVEQLETSTGLKFN